MVEEGKELNPGEICPYTSSPARFFFEKGAYSDFLRFLDTFSESFEFDPEWVKVSKAKKEVFYRELVNHPSFERKMWGYWIAVYEPTLSQKLTEELIELTYSKDAILMGILCLRPIKSEAFVLKLIYNKGLKLVDNVDRLCGSIPILSYKERLRLSTHSRHPDYTRDVILTRFQDKNAA